MKNMQKRIMSQNWSSDKSTPTINAIASATGKKYGNSYKSKQCAYHIVQ